MKNKILAIVFCCIYIFISYSCKKTDNNNNSNSSGCVNSIQPSDGISKIVGPRIGSVNQLLNYVIWFWHGGNGIFYNFTEKINGNSQRIHVNVSYECGIVYASLNLDSSIYTFKASNPGTYYLQADSSNVIDTVVIK